MKLVWLSLALAIAAGAPEAKAHSWYPLECCSERDCWAMGTDSDAKEPEPTMVPGGYRTRDGHFVPESDTRIARDGRYHVCRYSGALTGSVIKPAGRPTCLFVPGRGT